MSFAPTGRLSAREAISLARPHLLAAMALAAILCGWFLDGRPGWVAGALAAFDWLIAGLFNRISDVPEDLHRGVPGAAYAEKNAGALMRIVALALVISLAGAKPLGTPLLLARLVFHALAFAYSFPTVTERFKEMPVVKHPAIGALAALTCVGYPLALRSDAPAASRDAVLAAVVLLLGTALSFARQRWAARRPPRGESATDRSQR